MCELKDVHYVEFDQADEFMRIYEVDDAGIPTALIRQDYWEHINESGMTRARSWRDFIRHGIDPFACICGYTAINWEDMLYHCRVGLCRECKTACDLQILEVWNGLCYGCKVAEDEAAGVY